MFPLLPSGYHPKAWVTLCCSWDLPALLAALLPAWRPRTGSGRPRVHRTMCHQPTDQPKLLPGPALLPGFAPRCPGLCLRQAQASWGNVALNLTELGPRGHKRHKQLLSIFYLTCIKIDHSGFQSKQLIFISITYIFWRRRGRKNTLYKFVISDMFFPSWLIALIRHKETHILKILHLKLILFDLQQTDKSKKFKLIDDTLFQKRNRKLRRRLRTAELSPDEILNLRCIKSGD